MTLNLPVRKRALIAEFTAQFRLVELTFGRMPTVTRQYSTSTFQEIFARLSIGLPRWTPTSEGPFSRRTLPVRGGVKRSELQKRGSGGGPLTSQTAFGAPSKICSPVQGSRFKVEGRGFTVQSLGFGVQGLRVQGSGSRLEEPFHQSRPPARPNEHQTRFVGSKCCPLPKPRLELPALPSPNRVTKLGWEERERRGQRRIWG